MSIIIALVSAHCGVVASDGRRFTSAYPDRKIPARVELDNFDKTFSFLEGRLIGAFAGLLEFSGKTVREHVFETVSAWPGSCANYESLAQKIACDMREKLYRVRDDEVGFVYRMLDLLLVMGDPLAIDKPKLFAMRFEPHNGQIIANGPETVESSPRHIGKRICGVPEARKGVEKALSLVRNKRIDVGYLEALARRGINSGVFYSKNHPLGAEKACGGKTFIQCLGVSGAP